MNGKNLYTQAASRKLLTETANKSLGFTLNREFFIEIIHVTATSSIGNGHHNGDQLCLTESPRSPSLAECNTPLLMLPSFCF